jgi:ankyrin repeat protein
MDILPLPSCPNIENYKKRAKDLVKVAKTRKPGTIQAWGAEWIGTLTDLTGSSDNSFVNASFERAISDIGKGLCERMELDGDSEIGLLLGAQFLIARSHGFENWAVFAKHIEGVTGEGGNEFESAVDAVIGGDLPTLKSLLRQFPSLIKTHSSRIHRATLLHYVAANGVEDFRQITPPNAVEIAICLLDAGAEVGASANTYGGGKNQTAMNLLVSSAHPAKAGLMVPLVEALLDYGATINGLEGNGSPLEVALSFGYLDAAETLVARGAKVNNIATAASLDLMDLVERFFHNVGKLESEQALVCACKFGKTEIVKYLLRNEVGVGVVDWNNMTGLHWGAANGHIDVVKLLLDWRAPLEVRNQWGGSVLSSTVFFACNHPVRAADYETIIDLLLDAGAEISMVKYPTGKVSIDVVLKKYRELAK